MKLKLAATAVLMNFLFVSPTMAATFESGIQNGLFKKNAILTEHFRFEFSDLIESQTDSDGDGIPDVIEILAESAELSWDALVDDYGYQEPNSHTTSRVLVILDDTEEYLLAGSIGTTTVLTNDNALIAINPWLSEDYLQITMAHEFFHAIQFGYELGFSGYGQGVNFAESTAVWVEDEIYESNNDYVYYLEDYFDYNDYSIFASIAPSDTLYPYALNIWPKFLSEYYDDDSIRMIWELYVASSASFRDHMKLYDAFDSYVSDQGDDLGEVFQEFTLWNLALSPYEDGDLYPGLFYLDGFADGTYWDADEYFAPALYGSNYIYFENPGESSFNFHVIKPEETRYAVSLVPIQDGLMADIDSAERVIIDAGDEMASEMTLDGLGANDDVMVVLSPLDLDFDLLSSTEYIFDEGYLYSYLADFGDSIASSIEVEETLGTGDEKTGQEASETPEVRDVGLTMSLLDYDENSATFSWNRIADSDIAGYELHFGTESGDYDFVHAVDFAHVTVTVVPDLVEGQMYYFQLLAVDEDGEAVLEGSNELALMPEEWLFTDLSYLDPNFDSISVLTEMGVFQGYGDGSFQPNGVITRAELVKILVEGQGITPDPSTYNSCFTDVAFEWYAPYLCYAKDQDWVRGYEDGSFRPNETVSKVEALKILFEVYEAGLVEGTEVSGLPYPDVPGNEWYSIYVHEAAALGILEEAPEEDFTPHQGRTRAEMAEELYRYLVVEELARW